MRVLKLLVLVGSLFCTQAVIAEAVSDGRASAADTSAQESTSENNNDTQFWFEAIEGDHTVYWQFIEVYGKVKESLEKVARRLTKYITDYRPHGADILPYSNNPAQRQIADPQPRRHVELSANKNDQAPG